MSHTNVLAKPVNIAPNEAPNYLQCCSMLSCTVCNDNRGESYLVNEMAPIA